MIQKQSWVLGLLVFSVTAAASAQESEPVAEPAPATEPAPAGSANSSANVSSSDNAARGPKFQFGLRLGYALPLGNSSEGVKLGHDVSGQVPIWIDAGYFVTPNILLGLYGQYGIVQIKNCATGVDCSAHDLRFGVQGQYHVSPQQGIDPWFGLGLGYEILSASESQGGRSNDVSLSGFEFLNLQGGVDFAVTHAFTVGPFLSFSLGKYGKQSSTQNGVETSADIPNTSTHEWLTLGVKGSFGI